jgi:hypothetical protein
MESNLMTTIKASLGTQELDVQVNDGGMLKSCLTPHGRETLRELLDSFMESASVKFASLDIEGEVIAVGVEPAIDTYVRQDLRAEFSAVLSQTTESIVKNYLENGAPIDYSALPGGAAGGMESSVPPVNSAYNPRLVPEF